MGGSGVGEPGGWLVAVRASAADGTSRAARCSAGGIASVDGGSDFLIVAGGVAGGAACTGELKSIAAVGTQNDPGFPTVPRYAT